MNDTKWFSSVQRQCSKCIHWNIKSPILSKDGFIKAACIQARDSRDHILTRASDNCSHWDKKL